MDNQQEMLNQAEIGWLAGLIEGEGSITMNVRRKKWKGWNGIGVDMSVCVVNSDAGIMRKAVDIFRKLDIEPRIYERPTSSIPKRDGNGFYKNNSKTIITAQINRMTHILLVLETIKEHLAGEKYHRASLIIDFIKRRITRQTKRSKGGATWYDGYDWGLVKKFYKLSGGSLLPEVKQILRDYTQRTCESKL